MEGQKRATSKKQLNFRSYCLFCLQPQSPGFLFKLMRNNPKKIGSFQPLLHYLSGTDPTYDKSAFECANKNIPIMTNMPPMCQSCYDLLGDLHSLHQHLLETQCRIKEQTVRIRRVVSDTVKSSQPMSTSRTSAWKLFETAIHSSEMPNEQIQAACKFVKDFQTLIMDKGGKKILFPSKPPPNITSVLQQPPVASGTSNISPQNLVQPTPNRNPIQIRPNTGHIQPKGTVFRINPKPLTLRQRLLGQSQPGSVNNPTALSTTRAPVQLEQSSYFSCRPGEISESEKSQAGLYQNKDTIYSSEQSATTSSSGSRHSLPCASQKSTVVMLPTSTVKYENENFDADGDDGGSIADSKDDINEDEIKEEKNSDDEISESDIDTFSSLPVPTKTCPLPSNREDTLHLNAANTDTSSSALLENNLKDLNTETNSFETSQNSPVSVSSIISSRIEEMMNENVGHESNDEQEILINRNSKQIKSKYKGGNNSKSKKAKIGGRSGKWQHGQICDLCGVMISITDSVQHMETHVKDFVAICPNSPQCPLVFSCKLKMEKHLKNSPICQREGNYSINPTKKCPACDFETNSTLSLRKHFQIHEEEELTKPYACPIPGCTHSFAIRESVDIHIFQFHQNDLRPPKTEQNCPICKKSVLLTKIIEHLEEMHKITETYKCKHCPVVFHTEVKRMEHLFKDHRAGIEGIACDLCDNDDLKFIRLESLRLHYFNVHKIGTQSLLVCKHCSQEFALSGALTRHINRFHMKMQKPGQSQHTEKEKSKNNYQIQYVRCSICQIRCLSKQSLLTHKVKFHGVSISCKICNQKFENAGQHKRHMDEHAGVPKPLFTCEVGGCGKTFRMRSSFKAHKYFHSSNKPYICDTCGKGYVLERDLNLHKDSVHLGIRPICEICGESFMSKEVLRRHRLIHTGERPYSCPICQQPFRCRTVMQTHIRSHETKGDSFKPNGPMKHIRKRVVRKENAT